MCSQTIPDPLFTLRSEMESIHCLLFYTSGGCEFLYASTQAGFVHKWDLQKCREESRFKIGMEPCLAVKLFQQYFVTQSKGGEIKVWKEINETWELRNVFNVDYWGFCKLEVVRDEFLICPESGSKVKILTQDGNLKETLSPSLNENCGEIMAIKYFIFSKTEYIFVLSESGLLTVFMTSGSKVSDFKVSPDCPMAMDFDGESRVVVGGSGESIVGVELTRDLELVKWKEVNITNPGVSCLVIRPDRKLFVAGCWDFRIRLFSWKSFKLLAVLQNHTQTIQDIRYSLAKVDAWDCQSLLAAAGQDGRITLWNIY